MSTIVITGCSRGLGRAMAEWFAAQGHTVLGCGRNKAHMTELQSQLGEPHLFTAVDVLDDAAVQTWSQGVAAHLGGKVPDFLINNAALMNRPAPLWELSAAEFDPVIDVNIKGVANVLRHFLPAMVAAKRGVIVNFSSGWGRSTSPEVAPYCASKYAIEGLTLALAQELPAGMCAVPLNPGVIDTDMLRVAWSEGAASYPSPAQWVERAGPFILNLGPRENGKSLSVH